ncbi:DUF2637 domain-containing protein [Streptomyces naphthomycinicus]|uniref:DUF2637 domain-containing protein n=1 Tax=Streptomyces naphthomycinicus TaxID=2872625 RepID=UPI001CEC0924|nr:DUF2637 domain-containing protein [Streptomyces sp. TML10]
MRAQLARVDAVLVQALIAAALSFAHLHDVASAAGQDGWKAWAYPVSVDLLLVAAWRRLRSGVTKTAAWCWFVVALTASLGANVATAGLLHLGDVPAWLRILVAGWPAVAFLGGTLLAHSAPRATADAEDQDGEPVIEAQPELPPVPVPAALVAHARKVAAEHRARTGSVIDTSTLRARLGVPAPLAEAIAAQL